jgi:hypothetical protein
MQFMDMCKKRLNKETVETELGTKKQASKQTNKQTDINNYKVTNWKDRSKKQS